MRIIYDFADTSLFSLLSYFNFYNKITFDFGIFNFFNYSNLVLANLLSVIFLENLNIFMQYISLNQILTIDLISSWISVLLVLDQNTMFWFLSTELVFNMMLFNYSELVYSFNLVYIISWFYLFVIFYIFILLYIILMNSSFTSSIYLIYWINFITLYIYLWIYGSIDKIESSEESYCLFILWPWCVFLIFTHLFSIDNHTYIFGFAEWALPVLYGLVLLVEHFWTFGTYILVYLLGLRGRSSFIITLIEDIVSIVIMFARVILQAIRGIIVGMFHFICREALLNMTHWWEYDEWFAHSQSFETMSISFSYDIILVLMDFFFAAGSLVIVMAIMFLQLIFLIVSVWLFCKCWFISWQSFNINYFIVKSNNYHFKY